MARGGLTDGRVSSVKPHTLSELKMQASVTEGLPTEMLFWLQAWRVVYGKLEADEGF